MLGRKRSKIIKKYYSVTHQGNFDDRNILNSPIDKYEFSIKEQLNVNILEKIINESKLLLYQHREKRAKPLRDEKIITAWNGLMISAYAKAGFILDNNNYIKQASKSADFIFNNLLINNRLLRSFNDDTARLNGYLNDYAFFIAALIDLYESTHNIKWLKQAIRLDKILEKHFEDKNNGGFFMTSNDHEKLLSREKPDYDGALPSGNSVHILNLLRLGLFTSKEKYNKRAVSALKAFSRTLENTPMALAKMLISVDFYYDEAKEIVIITPQDKKNESKKFIDELRKTYLPNHVLSVIAEGLDLKRQSKIVSIAEGKVAINDQVTAYVCKLGSCELPTNNINIFSQQINSD